MKLGIVEDPMSCERVGLSDIREIQQYLKNIEKLRIFKISQQIPQIQGFPIIWS
jgi:hypothetical protein